VAAIRLFLRAHQSWLVATLCGMSVAASLACREQTSAQSASVVIAQSQAEVHATPTPAPQIAEPESESDQTIRRALRAAIDEDAALKNRAITFSIDEGDITVSGTVRTETERQKINELAMQISGVKSVANAVRVSPT
jgi:osmotically-inducible protein OsmY